MVLLGKKKNFKKKLYQSETIHVESQRISKMISDRLQKQKEKHEKQNVSVVNMTPAFTGKVRCSKIKAFPDPDEIKPDQYV